MLADAAPPPALASTDRPPPIRFQQDALWQKAMEDGDDIDLATLADREGASGLLDAFEVGGQVGRTALTAMPYASDAPVVYHRLAQVVLLTKDDTQRGIVQTVHDIALRPRRLREPVDEDGRAACAEALLRIAREDGAPRTTRALAVSTLRLPAFAGLVRQEQIPTGFDAPAASSSGRPRDRDVP
jgi:hypothetical protein